MTPLEVLTQNPRFFRICRHDGPVRVPLHLENTRLNEAAFGVPSGVDTLLDDIADYLDSIHSIDVRDIRLSRYKFYFLS